MRRLSWAALLLIAFVIGTSPQDLGAEVDRLPASPRSDTTDECTGPQRDSAFFLSLAETPVATSVDSQLIRDYRQSEVAAPQKDVELIMSSLVAVVSCHNAGDFSRTAALFSDRYWTAEVGGNRQKGEQLALSVSGATTTPDRKMEYRMSFSDARVLPDGRIAGFLRWDARDLKSTQLVSFINHREQWIIDQVVFATEMEVLGTPGGT